jgi:hypothetical protein
LPGRWDATAGVPYRLHLLSCPLLPGDGGAVKGEGEGIMVNKAD